MLGERIVELKSANARPLKSYFLNDGISVKNDENFLNETLVFIFISV